MNFAKTFYPLIIISILFLMAPTATGFCSTSTSTAASLNELETLETKMAMVSSLFSSSLDSEDDTLSNLKDQMADYKTELKSFKSGLSSYVSVQSKLAGLKALLSNTSSIKSSLIKSSLNEDLSTALNALGVIKAITAFL